MKLIKFFILLTILFQGFNSLYAIGSEEYIEIDKEKKTWGIIPVVVPFYTPETQFGVGGGMVFYRNPDPDNPKERTSQLTIGAVYTQLNQASVEMHSEQFFKQSAFKLNGYFIFSKFSELTYGVGPNTSKDNEEEYKYTKIIVKTSFLFEIIENLYMGPSFRYSHYIVDEKKKNSILSSQVPGNDGTDVSGLGIQISWDSRNSLFFTVHGFLLDVKLSICRKEFGGEYNYLKFLIDTRHFFKIAKDQVIALQGIFVINYGTVPFQDMPKMGGPYMMRGYYEGRFIDKNYLAVQTEYRFPIIWRFGGTLFFGCGEVADKIENYNTDYLRFAGGLGIRLTLQEKEKINFRLNIGFSDRGDIGIYFTILEAF